MPGISPRPRRRDAAARWPVPPPPVPPPVCRSGRRPRGGSRVRILARLLLGRAPRSSSARRRCRLLGRRRLGRSRSSSVEVVDWSPDSPVAPVSVHSPGCSARSLEVASPPWSARRRPPGRRRSGRSLTAVTNSCGEALRELAVAVVDRAARPRPSRLSSSSASSGGIVPSSLEPQPASASAKTHESRDIRVRASHRGESSHRLSAALAASLPHVQPAGQVLGQLGGDDRVGGAVDVVGDPVEGRLPGLGVELEPGGARVAVAGLADAARVDQPAAAADLEAGAGARLGAARVLGARPPGRRTRRGRRTGRRGSGRRSSPAWPGRGCTPRPGRARARTPRPGRGARRGRGRPRGSRRRARGRRGTRGSRRSSARGSSGPPPRRRARRSRCRAARARRGRGFRPGRPRSARGPGPRTRPAGRRSRRRRPGTRPRRRRRTRRRRAPPRGRAGWSGCR